MILFPSNQLVLKVAKNFNLLMVVIYLQQPKANKFSFITFGLEKVLELNCLKDIMEEFDSFYGMMMILDFIVLQMMETCIYGIFKIILLE